MQNLKILQVSKFALSEPGGIEQVCNEFHNIFEDNFSCTSLVFLSKKKRNNLHDNEVGFTSSFKILGQPFSFGYFNYLVKESKNYDILYIHYPNPVALFLCILTKRKFQKIILHWHSDIIKNPFINFLAQRFERFCLKYVSTIIATSKIYSEHSKSLRYFLDKVEIVPIGTEEKLLEAKKKFLHNGRLKLIFIGRLVKYKGLKFLLNTLKNFKNIELKIVGNGPLLGWILNHIKKFQLTDRIIILTNVSEDEKYELLRNSDFLILPSISRAEAFGVVLLESMSVCTPLITSNVKGSGMNFVNNQETSEKCGFTFENQNSNDLKELLSRIHKLSNEEYHFLSKNALLRHKNLFSRQEIKRKITDIIKNDKHS